MLLLWLLRGLRNTPNGFDGVAIDDDGLDGPQSTQFCRKVAQVIVGQVEPLKVRQQRDPRACKYTSTKAR